MANPFARLFPGKGTGKIEDFPAFLSRLVKEWNPKSVFSAVGASGASPVPVLVPGAEVRALYRNSDRPAAVVAGPSGAAAELDRLAAVVAAALVLIAEAEEVPRAVSSSGASYLPEYRDYAAFSSSPEGWVLLFDDGIEGEFSRLLDDLGPKRLAAAAAAAFSTEGIASVAAGTPGGRIAVTEPMAAYASRLLFPAAFRAGETSIRFRPRNFGGGLPIEADAPLAWFRFGVKTEAESLGGYWALRRPGSVAADRFPQLAASLVKAAGAALAAEFKALGIGGVASSGAAATEAPALDGSAAFSVKGELVIASSVLDLTIAVPQSYPRKIASLVGRAEAESVRAFLAIDRVLAPRIGGTAIDAYAHDYVVAEDRDGPAAPFRFLPAYEFLGLVSDGDYLKMVQNCLVRHVRGGELADLFFYRKTGAPDAASKSAIVRPQAFDLNRFVSALPNAVRETFVDSVKEGEGADSAERFISLNEGLYEAALSDARSGKLELGYRTFELLSGIHGRYVYPRKRKRLDAMIDSDYPLALLRGLPKRVFRAVVDSSDCATLAAAFVGRGEELDEIAPWCSARKLEDIRDELEKAAALLERGAADADAICGTRDRLARKAEEARDREPRERDTAPARRGGG